MLVNPNYHVHQELFRLWGKIHNLRDSLKVANATITKKGTDLKVSCYLDNQEIQDYFDKDPYNFAFNCLNPELAESCSDFKIYKMSKEEQKEIVYN